MVRSLALPHGIDEVQGQGKRAGAYHLHPAAAQRANAAAAWDHWGAVAFAMRLGQCLHCRYHATARIPAYGMLQLMAVAMTAMPAQQGCLPDVCQHSTTLSR